jgi:hypothetical protein
VAATGRARKIPPLLVARGAAAAVNTNPAAAAAAATSAALFYSKTLFTAAISTGKIVYLLSKNERARRERDLSLSNKFLLFQRGHRRHRPEAALILIAIRKGQQPPPPV